MKKNIVKKVLCLVLAAVTAFAMPLSISASELSSYPVIYVGEVADNPLYYNPNKIDASVAFDINSSDFTGYLTSMVAGVALSGLAGEGTGTSTVTNAIKSMMAPLLCGSDGKSQASNIGPWEYNEPLSEYREDEIYDGCIKAFSEASAGKIEDDKIFFFSYDWRLDPRENAARLRDFIDHAESYTGSKKVSLLNVGYGGIITNTYLSENMVHAENNVASCIFYNCPILGNAVIGDFMMGKIVRTAGDDDSLMGVINSISGAHRGEAFMKFIDEDITGILAGVFENLLGEGSVQKLFGKLFTLLVTTILKSQDGHKDLGKFYNTFAMDNDSIIYDDFLRDYLRNIPGLWALVPDEDFDEAIDFMFGDEFINSELNAKILNYRTILGKTEETLKTAQLEGINVCVVASYGFQIIPVTASLDDLSDGIESVKYASVGAITVENADDEGKFIHCISDHNHRSPDDDIEASYCVLPENTWFIKDLPHGDFTNSTVASFVSWLVFGFEQRTIWDSAQYPQYLKFSKYTNKLTANLTPEQENSGKKYGDADENGTISAADARLVLRYAVSLETPSKIQKIACDVDGDSKISASDARLVLRHAVGLIYAFPVEY